jgi:Ca2+-binding EF-hand superfamily protein
MPDYGRFAVETADGTMLHVQLRPYALPDLDAFQAQSGLPQAQAREALDRLQKFFIERFLSIHFRFGGSHLRRGTPAMTWVETWMAARGITSQNWNECIGQYLSEGQLALDQHVMEEELATLSGTEVESHRAPQDTEGQNLKQLLYYIAEEQSRQEGYIHRGVTCNSCDIKPIRGVRWRCSNCADYDLCSDCHSVGIHPRTHIFYEVKVPAPFFGSVRQPQAVSYPGKPHLMPRFLTPGLCKRFISETNYEKAEVEGLYDQFTCLASYPWEGDPCEIGAAIDRQGFEKAFVALTSMNPPRPNLIYDRLFAYYDVNGDGLIGFEEFLYGLACIHEKSKKKVKLMKVFEGYDVDDDDFVSRRDFLRMFRAFYAIQKEITRDLLAAQEEDLTVNGALDTISSSQPLSAAFTEVSIPRGERGTPAGKKPDAFGDVRNTERPAAERCEDTIERGTIIAHSWESKAGLPFDGEGSEPLSARRIRAQSARSDGHTELREVQFLHNGRSIPDARDEAVRERWRRRQFYTDEEEGFLPDSLPLNGSIEHAEALPSPALRHTSLEESRPVSPRSRSSSKVRFQDDVDEIRSNASTSSRPFNERYGGYEIPEAEKDFGKEIMWQVIEDGMNELLDSLFKKKEDLSMQAYATRIERRRWRDEIAAYKKAQEDKAREEQDPLMATAAAHINSVALPEQTLEELLRETGYTVVDVYADAALHSVTSTPPEDPNPSAYSDDNTSHFSLFRADGDSFVQTFESLTTLDPPLLGRGFDPTLPQFRPDNDEGERVLLLDPVRDGFVVCSEDDDDNYPVYEPPAARDPTMPQNRPDSIDDVAFQENSTTPFPLHLSPQSEVQRQQDSHLAQSAATLLTWTSPNSSSSKPIEPGASSKAQPNGHPTARTPPNEERLAELARLDEVEREDRARGGPGRLNFAEFEKFMRGYKGRSYGFVEGWLDLGSF